MKRLLVGLAMAFVLMFGSAGAANADWDFLTHTVDSGYDDMFTVHCNAGYNSLVPENTTAGRGFTRCNSSMDKIYVKAGQEIWCSYEQFWGVYAEEKMFDATGWHNLGSRGDGHGCTSHAD